MLPEVRVIHPIATTTSPKRRTKISWIKKDDLSPYYDLDGMANTLGVEKPDHFMDRISDACSDVDLPGLTEEERDKFIAEEEADAWRKYKSALVATFEEVCGFHKLDIVPLKTKRDVWRLVPQIDWMSAATEIRRTINGVGVFEFHTTLSLLDSGPYTPRAAVLCHLGWMKDYYEVYGSGSARSAFERRLR
jgi:hypothetical protein